MYKVNMLVPLHTILSLSAIFPLLFFICSSSSSAASTSFCSNGATPTIAIELHLDLALGFFGAFGSASATVQSNSSMYGMMSSYASMLDISSAAIQANAPLHSGLPPLLNQLVSYSGGRCFNVSIIPHYNVIPFDYNSDTDIVMNTKQSLAACGPAQLSSVTPNSAIVSAVHSTAIGTQLFDGFCTICNSFGIPTASTLLVDLPFSNKQYYPYSIRTTVALGPGCAAIVPTPRHFQWKRVAVIHVPLVQGTEYAELLAETPDIEFVPFTLNVDGSCDDALDVIEAEQYKIVFFLTFPTTYGPCMNSFVARGLLKRNYIPFFSTAVTSASPSNSVSDPTFNFSLSELKGSAGLIQPLIANPAVLSAWQTEVPKYYTQWAVDPNYLTNADTYTSYSVLIGMPRVAALQSQGLAGMTAQQLRAAKADMDLLSSLSDPFVNASTSAIIQTFIADFLSNFSMNSAVNMHGVSMNVSSDGGRYVVQVPYQSVQFNVSNAFFWSVNASGASSSSPFDDHSLRLDNNGDLAFDILTASWDGAKFVSTAVYSTVYSSYDVIPNTTMQWPNPAILDEYVNGIPTDRDPPTQLSVNCIICSDASALSVMSAAVAEKATPSSSHPQPVLFSSVATLQSIYQLDISYDNMADWHLQWQCDGTVPMTYASAPTVHGLPAVMMASSGLIQVTTSLLFAELDGLYESNPSAFSPAAQMTPLNAQQLQMIGNSTLDPNSLASAAAAIVGTIDANNHAYALSLLITCGNTANQIASVFTIVTHGPANIYTASSSAQDALVVMNSIGLFVVATIATFVYLHREHKVIFSSSVPFLFIILLGFAALFSSALLTILNATDSICQSKTVLFHLGFTLVLGAIFIKTYRLHRIFNSKQLMNLSLSSHKLFGTLFVLTLVDAVVLVVWMEVSGVGVESASHQHCYTASAGNVVFPAIFTVLKGILILSGVMLATKVKSLPTDFNESRSIVLVIYNAAVLSSIYIVVYFATSLQPNQLSIFTSTLLCAGTCINLLVFFVPKFHVMGMDIFHFSESGFTPESVNIMTASRKKSTVTGSTDISKRLGLNIDDAAAAQKQQLANALTTLRRDVTPRAPLPSDLRQTARVGSSHRFSVSMSLFGMPMESDIQNPDGLSAAAPVTVQRIASADWMDCVDELKQMYLSQLQAMKRRRLDLSRMEARANELNEGMNGLFDKLRTSVLNIRLMCHKLLRVEKQREKLRKKANSSDDEDKSTGNGFSMSAAAAELSVLISLPIEALDIDTDANTFIYRVVEQYQDMIPEAVKRHMHALSLRRMSQRRIMRAGSVIERDEADAAIVGQQLAATSDPISIRDTASLQMTDPAADEAVPRNQSEATEAFVRFHGLTAAATTDV